MKKLIILFFIVIGAGILLRIPNDFSNPLGGDIAAIKEWDKIILGKWETKIEIKSKIGKSRNLFEGEVEYFSKGEFKKYVTAKYYSSRINNNESLFFMGGGSVTGTWKTENDGTWVEYVKKCTMTVSEGDSRFDICKNVFNIDDGHIKYGTQKNEYGIYTVKTFTKSKIHVIGKNFSDEGTYNLIFIKVDE